MSTTSRPRSIGALPADASQSEATAAVDAAPGWEARGPILVAVDGSDECQPAIRLAHDLAERRGAKVHVVTVGEPRPGPIPPRLTESVSPADRIRAKEVRGKELTDIATFLTQTLGAEVAWPIEAVAGARAPGIAAEAARLGASLVLMGLRCHHAFDRALHDETTLNVMRTATCPVFGVTERLFGLPRRMLVGTDFSQASLAAARAALALVADDGAMVLAYVSSPRTPDQPDDGERVIHDLGVAAAFTWFDGELGRLDGTTVEHVVLQHHPDRSAYDLLVGYAMQTSVDAVALGSARHGRVERWLLGSVSTDAARDGRYPLLVVPPAGARA